MVFLRLLPAWRITATADDVQSAINFLSIDWNDDNDVNDNDDDHITVYREGDASSTYGYGYIYNFRLNGPEFKFGKSGIMGDSPVTIDVVGQGAADRLCGLNYEWS